MAIKNDYIKNMQKQQKEVQDLVLAGYEQAEQGKTKDFDMVCDRLEKKYLNETVQN